MCIIFSKKFTFLFRCKGRVTNLDKLYFLFSIFDFLFTRPSFLLRFVKILHNLVDKNKKIFYTIIRPSG